MRRVREVQPAIWLTAAAVLVGIAAGGLALWKRQHSVDNTRVYRIGYNTNPPYQIRRETGPPSGFAVEMLDRAAERSGIRLEWEYDESSSATKMLTGAVDLWPLFADLPERRGVVYVSAPWIISDYYLVIRGHNPPIPAGDFSGPVHYSGPAVFERLLTQAWPNARRQAVVDGPPRTVLPRRLSVCFRVFVSVRRSLSRTGAAVPGCRTPRRPSPGFNAASGSGF